jgi:hydroxymethylbilane synthase
MQDANLADVGGKGLFVKEIEDALLKGEIDLAVHSSKDMPAALPQGLTIGAVLPREDPCDAIILRAGTVDSLHAALAQLGPTPVLGTGSIRRIAQLTRLVPGARFLPIRGNLDTRLRKLDRGDYDALILAAAGLRRLGLTARVSFALPVDACLPAPGQGIVAIEVREGDPLVMPIMAAIHDARAGAALTSERAVVRALGGGCQMPLAALATNPTADTLELEAAVFSVDGRQQVRARANGTFDDADLMGVRVGAELLAQGAGNLLMDAHASDAAPAAGKERS